VFAGLVSFIVTRTSNPDWVRSNIFDLLPRSDYDPTVEQAINATQEEVSRRLVVLIGHPDRSTALRAGTQFAVELSSHPLIEAVESEVETERAAAVAGFYFPYRRQLLTNRQIESIEADGGERIGEAALASIYSIFGNANPQSLATDPFALFPESLSILQTEAANLSLSDGFLWASHEGREYLLISARARTDAMDWREQSRLVSDLNTLIADTIASSPGLTVLSTGFLIFAHAGTQRAQSEIALIGTGSVLGVILLMLVVFRSIRPLALAVLSLAFGCIAAISMSLLVFGSLHLFTLIFGASLIGVSIDYSFHFVSEYAFSPQERPASASIRKIFPGITLGLLSSAIACFCLRRSRD